MGDVIIGIDLAGVEKNQTGFAVLKGMNTVTNVLYSDEEIKESTLKENARLVTIDAPLGIPKGRCCLDYNCECRKFGCIREGGKAINEDGN